MFYGAHFLIYTKDAEADRAFFRDVLQFPYVDAGGGWLIFRLPPSELGVHPSDGSFVQRHADHDMLGSVFYLMCENLNACMTKLQAKGVSCTPVQEAEWGYSTSLLLPGGGRIGLYQPTHTAAINSPAIRDEIQKLLDELCGQYGFCLAPAAKSRLMEHPPTDAEVFTEEVFRAEGFSLPPSDRDLYRQVYEVVSDTFRAITR